MKITDINPVSNIAVVKKSEKKQSTDKTVKFSSLLEAENIENVSDIDLVENSSLLANFNFDLLNSEQFLIDNANNALKDLTNLRIEIASGKVEKHTLSKLKEDLDSIQTKNFISPKLKEILDEINLTTSVELAKFERGK